MANDPYFRSGLISYIKENCPDSLLIEELKTDIKYDTYPGEEISYKKENIEDIYYWITRYKDVIITRLKKARPITVGYTKRKNIYNSLLLQLSSMRARFIKANPELNYYVMKITYKTNLGNIYYLNSSIIEKIKWNIRKRHLVNGAPGCS